MNNFGMRRACHNILYFFLESKMETKQKRTKLEVSVSALTWAVLTLFMMGNLSCQNHEHPTEHPAEHPSESGKSAGVTKDQLADAVEAYVEKKSAAQGGHFVVKDDKTGKELKLSLEKVHRKRLSKVGQDLYFACADFKTPEGKIYDLDVFMKGSDKEHLTFSKFTVHKESGKERYTWYEKGGIWKMKPLGGGLEHPPEHPKEHPAEHPSEHPK